VAYELSQRTAFAATGSKAYIVAFGSAHEFTHCAADFPSVNEANITAFRSANDAAERTALGWAIINTDSTADYTTVVSACGASHISSLRAANWRAKCTTIMPAIQSTDQWA
jgi:hypothetical protein